jgi:hypothetical protein
MSTGILAVQILERLLQHSSLKDNLQFHHIQRFFALTSRLWLEIVPPNKPRPLHLPSDITNFLSFALQLESAVVQLTWTAFGDLAEAAYLNYDENSMDEDFKRHGHQHQIGKGVRFNLKGTDLQLTLKIRRRDTYIAGDFLLSSRLQLGESQ